MANIITKEEHARMQRRHRRQATGVLVLLLLLVGVGTVVSWGARGVGALLDDSGRRAEYENRLTGLVMLDPLPFDSLEQADPVVFKEAAIWGVVYNITDVAGNLDAYERDPDTDCVILPALEVDAYLSQLLGPDYQISDGSFETDDMNYLYDSDKAGYLIPVTGQVALYTAKVEKIQKKSGLQYVTVGYIPTATTSSDLTLTAPTEPVKYMDYVFARGANRQWYLKALQESEMKPAVSVVPNDTTDYDLDYDPTEALQSAINSEAANSVAVDSSVTEEDSVAESAAAEDGEASSEAGSDAESSSASSEEEDSSSSR